jgi:hypothetical protein
MTICSYSSVRIIIFLSLIIEEKTSSLVPYDENENFVTERYYSVTKFCIVTSKMSWIRVFLLVIQFEPFIGNSFLTHHVA